MSFSEPDSLDKVLDSAISEAFERPAEPEKSDSLDKLLNDGLDRHGYEDDLTRAGDGAPVMMDDDFRQSREVRASLRESFPATEGKNSIGQLLDSFLTWDERFRANPIAAADALAADYLKMPPVTPKANGTSKAKTLNDETGLDRAIIAGMKEKDDNARDADDWKSTEAARAKLKELYPHLTFKQALESVRTMDEEMRKDPIGFGARLSAMYGAPVTDGQHREIAHRQINEQNANGVMAVMAQVAQALPDYARLEPIMASVMEHPQFQRTGDIAQDMRRAHQYASQYERELLKADLADHKRQLAEVEKARRVMPTKGGGTAPNARPASRGDALDNAISEAMG